MAISSRRFGIRSWNLRWWIPGSAEALQKHETFTVTATQDESEHTFAARPQTFREVMKPQEKAWVQARLQALNASAQLAEP